MSRINKKEKDKEFNQIFITLLNKIIDKPAKAFQIEFYTIGLPPPVFMFVKRKEIQTLKENFVESIKFEKHLAAISNHPGNEERKASTSENNGKKNKETKSEWKDRVILQLYNDIMNMKRNKGEGKKLVKNKTNKNTSPQIPPTSRINLEDYAMENFCRPHYANHLEKTCPKFINLFKEMILPW